MHNLPLRLAFCKINLDTRSMNYCDLNVLPDITEDFVLQVGSAVRCASDICLKRILLDGNIPKSVSKLFGRKASNVLAQTDQVARLRVKLPSN